MNRTEYYRGKPNTKYGIWNDVSKQFQFNISEDTPFLAIARLYQKIGDDAKKARFEPKKLPKKHDKALKATGNDIVLLPIDNSTRNLTDEETEIYESWIDHEAKDTDVNIMDGDTNERR